MKYCKKCVLPDTRPSITINQEGLCSACEGHEEKTSKIDWEARQKQLEEVISSSRSSHGLYDCIIPVSGGKDSTYQVHVMKERFGLNPLAVTYAYGDRTELGEKNLYNLRKLGVDHIEFAPSPDVESKFIKKAFIECGDPCIPDHLGIFAVCLRAAINFKIPMIVWGENPELEYGGSVLDRENPYLDRKWLSKHGCLKGKLAEDWVDENLSLSDLAIFEVPTDDDFHRFPISSLFLGYFIPWDPIENARIAAELGFEKSSNGPLLGLYDFADLDSTNIIVHHYIKLVKFGISRLHDNISVEIRNGRMTREEGVHILKTKPERVPLEEIRLLCKQIDITEEEFWQVLEKFRNHDIWEKQGAEWVLKYPIA
jgi:N-acetyl sugar amidotransferase